MNEAHDQRLADVVREVESMMGPYPKGRPVFYQLGHAVRALRDARDEVVAYRLTEDAGRARV